MSDFDKKDKQLADGITLIAAFGFVCLIVFIVLLFAFGIREVDPDTVAFADYWIVYFTAGLFGTSVLGIFVSAGAALIVKRTLEVNAELLRATRSEEMRRLRSYIAIEPPNLSYEARPTLNGFQFEAYVLQYSVINAGATPAKIESLQHGCELCAIAELGETLEATFSRARGDGFMVDGVGLPSPRAIALYLSANRTQQFEEVLDPAFPWRDDERYLHLSHAILFWASVIYEDVYGQKRLSEFAFYQKNPDSYFRTLPPNCYALRTDQLM